MLLPQAGNPAAAADYFERGEAMLREHQASRVGAAVTVGSAGAAVSGRPYALSDLNSWGMALDQLDRRAPASVPRGD